MAVQMLLDLSFTQEEDALAYTQKRVDEIEESLDKVRKRLFAEVGALKKICSLLIHENEEIKSYLSSSGYMPLTQQLLAKPKVTPDESPEDEKI